MRTTSDIQVPYTTYSLRLVEIPLENLERKLVRNPAYSVQKASLNDWCWYPIEANWRRELQPLYDRLADSIAQEGFRNPVLVWSLYEADYLSIGCSRLKAAHMLGLRHITALVNDFTGAYYNWTEIPKTLDDVRACFKDQPSHLCISNEGLVYTGLPKWSNDV